MYREGNKRTLPSYRPRPLHEIELRVTHRVFDVGYWHRLASTLNRVCVCCVCVCVCGLMVRIRARVKVKVKARLRLRLRLRLSLRLGFASEHMSGRCGCVVLEKFARLVTWPPEGFLTNANTPSTAAKINITREQMTIAENVGTIQGSKLSIPPACACVIAAGLHDICVLVILTTLLI